MAFTAEDLFNSIDTIVGQRLSALSFDTTVIATIVDDSKKAQGHYVVSDGSIKFDAYTNDTNYKIDDQVRVTVLNGDWSQKKFIAGKYVDDKANMQPIHYTSPLGTTMGMGSTPLGTRNYWDLETNNRSLMQTDPVTIHIDADDTTLQVEGIYNVITLSTEVKTNMGAIGSVTSGNYGILVEFVMQPAQGTTIKRFFTFDSSEMIGNPYAFILDTHQEKKIVIPTIGHVIAINISAYQGLVYDDEGRAHPAPFVDKSGQEIGNYPIVFNKTTIGFGSDLTAIEDNSLKLYTLDSATYQWNNGNGNNHTKRLGFVWYNKDDSDEYVGYSDGICDSNYDEIEYLRTKTLDSRLVAQQGKEVPNDEQSLRLAANVAEAEPLMRKAYQALTTNLSQVFQRLDNQLVGAIEIQEALAPLINAYTIDQTTYTAKLLAAFETAKQATEDLVAFYKGVLKYGYHMSTQTQGDPWQDSWDTADPYTTFLDVFNNETTGVKKIIADFFDFMEEKTAKGEVLSGYRPFYNDYKPKINTQLAIIDSYLDQIPIEPNEAELLHGYKTKNNYVEYDKGEEYWKQFANRYCVYWYRYNPHYLSTHTVPISQDEWNTLATKPTSHDTYETYVSYVEQQNLEHKYGDFLGNYWERIRQNNTEVLQNYGVPKGTDGKPLPTSSDEPITLQRTLDPTTDNESYQIVMFYNHEMIKSNVVTFTNTEAHLIPPDSKTDGGDKLLIEHDVDSRDHYQAYSSAYDLLNIRDGSLYRQIKCTYDGVLAGNEAMADAEIYWYVPVNSTMITYDLAFLKNKGFNTDAELEAPTAYSKDGYVYFNRKIGYTEKMEDLLDSDSNPIYKDDGTKQQKSVVEITEADRFFFYKIKNFYEPSAQNNTILVEVYVPNKVEPTKGELTLTFGTFGTNGTKYTLAVVPAGTQTSLQPNGEEEAGDLELKITLYNADGEALDLNTNYGGEFYSLSKEWYTKSAAAPNLGELTQIVTAESDPDAAEQQTPQSSKSWLLSIPGATGTNYDDNRYVGIVKVSTTFQSGPENDSNEIELSTLYAVPYSSSEDLYISGPTSIVYNGQGTISRMSEEPFKLYQHKLVNRYLVNHNLDNDIYTTFKANGGKPEDYTEEYLRTQYPDDIIELNYIDSYDEEVSGQKWQLLYYQSDGNIATDPENTIHSYLDYMPTLNLDNTLRPAPMYYDYKGAADEEYIFYIPVAQCKDENDNILWTQPIIIIQNRYESAMLNAWDGSLQIDEANGTIMSTMMGAGIKNKDNTFSGVLMGDIVAGADFDTENVRNNMAIPPQNATGIGLYGFHEGAQSFNFNIDGTAFLGKNGHGRLMFDGNHGFLYSANWFESFYAKNEDGSYKTDNTQPTQYGQKNVFLFDGERRPFVDDLETGLKRLGVGRAGMAIDLQRGHMDAYDFKLTGSRIHFNSHPENIGFGLTNSEKEKITGYFMRIGNDGITRVDPSELAIGDDEYLLRKTPGLIAMDAEGNLTIRVNSLYLTGNMGGTNLLRQTAPKKIVPVIQSWTTATDTEPAAPLYEKTDEDGNTFIEYTWALTKWDYTGKPTKWPPEASDLLLEAELRGMENDEALLSRNHSLKIYNNDYTISQTVNNISGKQDYTISGYVTGLEDDGILTITIPGTTKSVHAIASQDKEFDPTQISYDQTSWTKFIYTFTTNEDITALTVSLTGTNNYALWHLMLENGGTASDWSAAPDDIEENTENEQLNYDTYLTQDEIFKKLTTNPVNGEKMVGIWLLPGEDTASGHKELYINATYMSTGILRSSNWGGELAKVATNKKDSYGNTIYNYEITKDPTAGLYFNLDTGKMWAANFALYAGTQNSENYIGFFSTDDYSPTLAIGNSTALSTWRIVAGKNFGVTKMGTLYASNADITGNIYADYIEAESGLVGGWKIGEESLYYISEGSEFFGTDQEEVKASVRLNGKNGTIKLGDNFSATNTGLVTAFNAVLNDLTVNTTLIMQGKMHIGEKPESGSLAMPSKAQFMVSGGSIIKGKMLINDTSTTGSSLPQYAQLMVGGDTIVSGKMRIQEKLSYTSQMPTNASLYIKGNTIISGKLFIASTASIGAEFSDDYDVVIGKEGTTSLSTYIGGKLVIGSNDIRFGTPTSADRIWYQDGWLGIDSGGYVKIGSYNGGRVSLCCNPVDNSQYDLTLPLADRVYVQTAPVSNGYYTGQSLKEFVTSVAGVKVKGEVNYYYEFDGTANFALALTNDGTTTSPVATLKAPAKKGSIYSLLYTSDTEGGTAWMSAPTLNWSVPMYCQKTGSSDYEFAWKTINLSNGSSCVSAAAAGALASAVVGQYDGEHGALVYYLYADALKKNLTIKYSASSSETYDGKKAVTIDLSGYSKSDTWQANTASANGYVTAGSGHANKVWKTDADGVPGWRDDATGSTNAASITLRKKEGEYLVSSGYSSAEMSDDLSGTYMRATSISRATAATAHSSRLYKNSIENISNSDMLYQLRPVSYFYNKDMHISDGRHYGFIAEEVEEFAPELVSIIYDKDGNRENVSLFYNSIIGLAVAEIQKLRKELDNLKSTLNID